MVILALAGGGAAAVLASKQGVKENFEYVFRTPEEIPIIRWLANSVLISTCVTLLVLTVDSLAAYGLARLRLPVRG